MYFNISDIKTYNIDESYKQCFSNIKNSVEYSLAIDYMLKRFDKNIVKEICLFLYKFKFATKKQIINIIGKKYNISIDFNFQELVDFDFFKDFILVKGFVDEEYERNEDNTIKASKRDKALFIDSCRQEFSLKALCEEAKISKRTYYRMIASAKLINIS